MTRFASSFVRFAVFAVAMIAGFTAMSTAAQADREFSLRYTANDTGSIKGIANTNMTCSTASGATGSGTCASARTAAVTDSVNSANDMRNNNAHTSAYIDVDSDGSTFNSSTADQNLPAGSTIQFAALYWGGHYSGASSPANANLRNQVKFKVPGASGYQTVTASVLDDGVGSNAGRYQAFADVTSLLQPLPNAGNGTYAVADIQAAIGSDRYAGWSLIVAYRNPAETTKNLSIFDGLVSISGTITRDINISGFLTPPSGPLNSDVGFVTWEGDLGLNGDRARINGQYLSDAQHPSNNFFDSRISHNGVLFTDRNPAYPNSMGMDAAWTAPPSGAIGHNATSAKITVNSTGDQFLPGVITYQVEIYSPKIEQTKTATDVNGGKLEQGDVITYRIAGKNTGDDGTANFVLRDSIPANTSYVPGSIKIQKSGGGPTGSQTDPAGDDQAEFDAANNRVIARLGAGANTSVGGNIAPEQEYEVSFQVRVNGPESNPVPDLTVIDNVATATFLSQTGGAPLQAEADAKSTVNAPDLRIKKTRSGADFVSGGSSQYTFKVDNHGSAKTQGQVKVSDPLAAGLTATEVTAPGWSCNALPAVQLTCTRDDALAPGANYPDIVVTVAIDDAVTDEVENLATVSGGGDANLGDNTSSSTNPVTRVADLSIVKSASKDAVKIGDTFDYTLKVTNNGPSKATSVAVSDPIPAGLSFVSADPGCTHQPVSGTVVCDLGSLANGASKTINLKVKVDGDAAGGIDNTATVTAQQHDPDLTNNSSTTRVDASGADLKVTKTLKSPTDGIKTGDTVTWKIVLENNGPSDATGVVLYDALPAGLTDVNADRDGCSVTGGAIECPIGDLADGDSVTVLVTGKVKAGHDKLTNTASATGNEHDPNPGDNTSTVTDPVAQPADVEITKSASKSNPVAGDTVIYTLTAKNNGPATAENVVVTDRLPAGVTFVSADAPCVESDGEVSCEVGDLAPGETVALRVKVKINGWPAVPADDAHGIDVQKVETQIDLNPGETKTVRAECPAGYFVSDGSVRIDHIDQGTGSWVSPEVTESRAVDSRNWQGTVTNTATGRAQAKVFAVCIRETTDPNGHSHGIDVSEPVVKTISLHPGKNEAILKCPVGTVAIAPGFLADSPGHLTYSQPAGNGWKFVYKTDADKPHDKVAFSIRCLDRQLTEANGAIPELALERIWTEQVIQPGQVHEVQLTCPDGSKGIVGGWDLDKGLVSLGNDPRPVTRAFKVYNPTDKPLTARFSLLCLGNRTIGGDADSNLRKITNTAEVATSTDETDYDNNSSSVTITANRVGEPVPEGTGKPPVNNPTDRDIHRPGVKVKAHGKARFRGGKVRVKVRASGETRGRIKLVTSKRFQLGGKRVRKGTVLAKGSYRFGRAGTRSLGLKTTKTGRKLLRKKGVRRAKLVVGGKSGGSIRIGR